MTIPAAPVELGLAKILFLSYNAAGSNAAALLYACVTKTVNAETMGYMGVGSSPDLATFAAGDPVMLGAGYDGTLTRKILVDTGGRQIVAGEIVDNAAFTDGTTKVLPAGYIYDEVAGTALTENDAVAARVDVKRAQVFVVEDATTRGRRQLVTAAGAAAVGNIITRIPVTPVVSNAVAYTAKDAIGALMTFASAVNGVGGSGRITAVQIEDKDQQMAQGNMDLILFDRTIAAPTDNAIFAPSDAELANVIAVIPFAATTDWTDLSTNCVAHKTLDIGFKLEASTTSIFGVLVARGTPTYASTSSIVVTITVQQN